MSVRLRKTLGVVMALIGGASFLSGFVLSGDMDQSALRTWELPLGNVQGMAVDSQGRIYLALAFYSRIQRYNAEGNFQLGWAAQSGGGPLTIAMQGADTIVVEAGRRHARLLFDADGNLLAEQPDPGQGSLPSDDPVVADGPDGSRLALRHGLLSASIVRDSAGITTTVIAGPRYLRYLGGVQSWILFAIGMITFWGGLPHLKRRPASA
jgi:hypothetical protein